ncbi:MAG: hypothetical protein Q9187_001958 [Circinaria calcarea]
MADVEAQGSGTGEGAADPIPQKAGDRDLSGRKALSSSISASNNDVNSTFSNPVSLDDGSSDPMDEYLPGYGKLAAIEDCDPNFLIYRKFGWLHNRVLLHYQDELAEYEEQLEDIDRFDR